MKIRRVKIQKEEEKSKKKVRSKKQKGGSADLIESGYTQKGPLGLTVGTNGSPLITVNNAIAFAVSTPIAVFKTIDFVMGVTSLPSDLGYAYNMENPPDDTNLNLMGGKKNKYSKQKETSNKIHTKKDGKSKQNK